jgi:protein O-mannosyl-transferase
MHRDILISFALALATGLSFVGVLSNGFVNLDDDVYVYENNVVRTGLTRRSVNWAISTTYLGNWHPLTWLSLELDEQLFGLNPAGYHATSLALHVTNTVLVFWLLRNMTGAAGRSACAAAFFGLHPLHVESVAWISERKDVLSTFFLLLSMVMWLVFARRSARWAYALAVALFLLSLMSKAMGITSPLVLLLMDYWPLARWSGAWPFNSEPAATAKTDSMETPAHFNDPSGASFAGAGGYRLNDVGTKQVGTKGLVLEKLPFILISATFAAITVLLQGGSGAMEYGRSLTVAQRLLIIPVNYVTYLRQTLWPVDLVVLYPHPGADLPLWKPLCALLLLVAMTLVAVRLKWSFPYLLVGWLWFLITLLPVIGFTQIGRQATADRYMYFPIVGLLILLCWGAYDLSLRRRWLRWPMMAGTAILLFVSAELTSRQVAVWRNDMTLWEHALAVAPPTSTACGNYGKALYLLGKEEDAERQFRRALTLDPLLFAANFDLGVLLGKQGRYAEAAGYFTKALEANPNNPTVLDLLGMSEEQSGHLDAAIEHYQLAVQLNPQSRAVQGLQRARQKKARNTQVPHKDRAE